ncbi:MAG: phosphoribosylglycinamide formyltransferase [Deltaproteobacteria bacterium]
MLTLGVLVSGSGTNLQAILDAVAGGTLDARVAVVLSNKPAVGALDRAARAGVATDVLSHRAFASREAFDAEVVTRLRSRGVDTVVLAGFLRVVTPVLLDAFPDRVVNIHPSLLPAFPGLDAQGQALAAGVKITGCSVHFVDTGTDTGPVIVQAAVPVMDDDTHDSLRDRILAMEHLTFPAALQWLAEGRVRLVDRKVRVEGPRADFAVSSPPVPEAAR